jgi:hypothetical protein
VTITAEERAKLLSELSIGHDLLAACANVGIDPDEVRADPELLAQAERAFEAATSKFRSKLSVKCLAGGPADITTLARLVDQRRTCSASSSRWLGRATAASI